MGKEYEMTEELIRYPPSWLHGYWQVAREWYVVPGRTDLGIGDLVFFDGAKYFIVEVKHLHEGSGHNPRVSRTQARNLAKEQAQRYGRAWAAKYPGKRVDACAYFGPQEPHVIFTIQYESPVTFKWLYGDQDESPATSGCRSLVKEEESPATSGGGGWGFLGIGIALLGAAALTYAVAADANQREEERRESERSRSRYNDR